ncbi:MAG: Ig-like domain-containing protein, partial [Dokdonia sp.]
MIHTHAHSFYKKTPLLRAVVLILLIFVSISGKAQYAKDGNLTVSAANTILNNYTAVVSDVAAGATAIDVNDISGELGGLVSGDLILIYQAQGAVINTSNSVSYGAITDINGAGTYEYAYVESVSGNQITVCPLTRSYLVSGFTQVVKVPQYDTLTINTGASVIPLAWQDSGSFRRGGIIAINAINVINDGAINASNSGFRGGVRENNTSSAGATVYTDYVTTSSSISAEKGESIVGFGPQYDALGGRYGRGAPANGGGGGNAHNAGGGGGANGNNGNVWFNGTGIMCSSCTGSTAWTLDPDYVANGNMLTNSSGGGRGGYSYASSNQNALTVAPGNSGWGGDFRDAVGGLGGRPLNAAPTQTIFFGGGGGAGDGNNSANADGGNGGGIILMDANAVSGSGNILANGQNAPDTVSGHNDAPGGGGAGGSIIIQAATIANALNLSAVGGQGGEQLITGNESEGPGGGGSGGYIAITTGSPTILIEGGINGVTSSSAVTEFPTNGATIGAPGQSVSFGGDLVVSCIIATANDFSPTPVNGPSGGSTSSVFPNDTLNGTNFADADVNVSITNNDGLTGLTINPDGTFDIPPGSTAGTFNVVYQICESLSSSNCDSAIATIVVLPDPCDAIASGNLDTDSDTVSDICDVDDDNDGILDTEELNCAPDPVVLGQSFSDNSTETITINNLYTFDPDGAGPLAPITATFSAVLENTTDSNVNAGVGPNWPTGGGGLSDVSGGTVLQSRLDDSDFDDGRTALYTLTFSEPVYNLAFSWGGLDNNDRTDFSADGLLIIQNIDALDASGSFISGTSVYSEDPSGNAPANAVRVLTSGPITTVTMRAAKDPASGAQNGGNVTLGLFDLTYCAVVDSDGDTLPDHLDTDSDNDGCFDAIEAAGSQTLDDLDSGTGQISGASDGTGLPSSLGGTPQSTTTAVTDDTDNDACLMLVDDTDTTTEDTPVNIDVLANDTLQGTYGTDFEISELTDPANGTVTIEPDGTVTYTPDPDFNGTDTFDYTVIITNPDGSTDTETATVVVTITPVNDTPTATDDTVSVDEDDTVNIDVLTNDDFGGDGPSSGTITVNGDALNGTATLNDGGTPLDPTDDTVDYTPNPDYNGTDTFTYTITDSNGDTSTATVTVTVDPINDTPTATDDTVSVDEDDTVNIDVLTNDDFGGDGPSSGTITVNGDALNGTATLNDGGTPLDPTDDTVDYTPNPDFNGTDTFTYTITDSNGDTSTATVTVTVDPINDTPTATDDTVSVDEDDTVNIDVLTNDDFEGDGPSSGTITVNGDALNGTATLNDGGTPLDPTDDTVDYTSNPDFNGTDTFTYTITDSNGDTSTATVIVTVTPVDDVMDDTATTPEDTPVDIDVLANDDFDPGSMVDVTDVSDPANGTVTINPDGTVTYTPDPDFNGTDTFDYTVTVTNPDGSTTTETATVVVTVTPV